MNGTNKNVVITKMARIKLVKARAGDITLPKIAGMAFGNGGVGPDGTVIPPDEGQTGLRNEIYRKAVTGHTYPEESTCRYECTLGLSECAGEEISEIALVDADGDIVGIKAFTRKGKDDDVEQTYWLDDIF